MASSSQQRDQAPLFPLAHPPAPQRRGNNLLISAPAIQHSSGIKRTTNLYNLPRRSPFVMTDEPKQVVREAYDNIAPWYLNWVTSQFSPRTRYTSQLLALAPSSPPHVLELGCGPGVPVTRMLLDAGATVVANDISTAQLTLASEHCPEATFLPGDMTKITFPDHSFDGVTCFFTIFHLPRSEQRDMLRKVYGWLKPGGVFVCNFATFDEEEIFGEFMGYGTFWSSYGVEGSKSILREVGFEIVDVETLAGSDGMLGEDEPDFGVKFMWICARKVRD